MMHRRMYVLGITLLMLFSILPAGTPTVPHLYAAPGRAVEPAADIPSTSVVSTITGYAAPEVFGTATYRSSNLQLQSSSTFTYGAATRLRFTTDGDCSKISDTAIRCRPGTTCLEVDTDYRFDVTATATGFIHAITSTSEQPVNQTVELMYPATFKYIGADIPPDSHTQNTLYWNRPDTTSFAAEITFDVTRCTTAPDTMLVLDGSTSISTNGFRQMQDFAQNLVNTVTIGPDAARFGIVQFGTQGSGRLEVPLSDSASGLASAIDDLRLMRGATDIQEGLALARTELEAKQRAGVPQVIVLLTDGAHNQSGNPVDEAHLAWQSGIHILTVAVGGADRDHLKAIATNPNYLFTVSDFNGLSVILNTLVQDVCNPDGAGPGEDTKPESLTVRSIEPNEGSHDAAITSIIAGTGFDTTSVPNVQLRNAAGRYDLETITVESDTVLQATIPAGLAPGSYELIVTNPDGQHATLANAFTVSAREPVISRVIPAAGYTDQDNEVMVSGRNFATGVSLHLGPTTLNTTRASGTLLRAIVPAGFDTGTYTMTVTNPDGQSAELAYAYTVLDADSNNDLLGYSHELWVNPVTPRVGEAAEVGLFVHRLGGKAVLRDVTVEFRRDTVDGTVLGRSSVPFLDPPDSVDSTIPLEVTFDQAETVDLYAIIDPDNLVPEETERTNVVSRTVTVGPPTADRTVPLIQRILVDGAAGASVSVPNATVDITASDPQPNPSGMQSIHIIEYVYNAGAGQWVPVVQSGWLPYGQTPDSYRWSLLPLVGMHYVQVRAVDQAGNISIGKAQQLANYQPTAQQIERRETHTYRYNVADGQQVQISLEVLSGDADLYVWSSRDDQSARVSNLDGSVNEQVIVPAGEVVPGVYQVEVYGYTTAQYRLTAEIGAPSVQLQAAPAVGGKSPTKNKPTAPVVPVSSVPDERAGIPPAPAISAGSSIYLPLVVR
ncbi:MAG: VWA domain-containing protein [Chloroflexaceae bacterium]